MTIWKWNEFAHFPTLEPIGIHQYVVLSKARESAKLNSKHIIVLVYIYIYLYTYINRTRVIQITPFFQTH